MNIPSLTTRLTTALRLRRALQLVFTAAPRWTLCSLALVAVQGLLPLAALLLLKQIVDLLTLAVATPEPGQFAAVALWIALAGVVALLTALVGSLDAYAAEAQSLAVADHVADILHARSVAVDLSYYETPAFHDTFHQAQQQAPYRPASIVTALKQTAQHTLTLLGIAGLLFTFHWGVGLALFAAAAPAALARLGASRRRLRFQQEHAEGERLGWYYHWLLTSAEYARDMRLLGIGGVFAERYRELRAGLRAGHLAVTRARVRGDLLAQGAATLVLFGTLSFMAYGAVQGVLTVGLIVMYFQAYQRALASLQGVLQGLASLYEDNLFLRQFHEFLDLPAPVEQGGGRLDVPNTPTSGLVCRGVTFAYPSRGEPVLCDIDLDVGPGEIVALVGVNGAGKSTLVKLLCRLYAPSAGTIAWGGVSLADLDPKAWRRQISVVSQDVPRFEVTVADNIRFGDVGKTARGEEFAPAVAKAGLTATLARLPAGLDTLLGTRFRDGHELSVGEWQRLALARAWFRDGQLLILDEPTSALDPLAEASLIDSLRSIIGKRSALIISHRLSTVQLADRIYVLERGRIVEQGRHAELLGGGGRYARLYRAQADRYQTEASTPP
jgi:ATP-binding cassette subfamily B protein